MELKEAIRQSYLVRGLSPVEIMALTGIAASRTYSDGEEILRRGDTARDLLIFCEGQGRIVTTAGDKIADMGPGRVVGEMALIDNAPRSATVLSVGRSTVAILPCDKLQTLMNEKPNIELVLLRNVSKVLCDHIRRNNVELEKYYFLVGG